MVKTQTIINVGLILLMITGFTTVIVLDDKGVELEPTHYCKSIGIKMYCARTTEMYCYPKLDTRLGSKKCSEGWKEIPLPKDFAYTIQLLRKALSERLKILKNLEFIESSSVSLINRTKLLDALKKIQGEIRSRVKPPKILFRAASTQSEAMKIHHALELLQTQGVNALKNYFQSSI